MKMTSGLAIAGLLLALWQPASADALYCDGRLVRVGDPIWQVGRVCPRPFWREDHDEPVARDARGRVIGWHRVEAWTLNFGPHRFMRRLVFRDGYLARVDNLGYGVRWEPGTRRCDWRELEQAGNTAAEIFARCGEPDHRYPLSSPRGYGGYAGPWSGHGQPERWVYDFSDGRRAVELDFINGRLQHRQRIPR